jgi:16S rRNA (guanine966-N2)-methyltransferase
MLKYIPASTEVSRIALTRKCFFCSIEKIMRITGGTGKGRKLRVPAGSRVRPTSDKVKQALFNILAGRVRDAAFLDLFSGTGGIGIEALSRGAKQVFFVDDSRDSLQATRHNLEQAGFGNEAKVVASRAESFLKKTEEQFDIIFLDPPYSLEQQPLLECVSESRVIRPDSIVVYEHFKKQESPQAAGRLVLDREAVYGDTVLAFYRMNEGRYRG